MPRSLVGLLAAAGATMCALVGLAHGLILLLVLFIGAAATGLAVGTPAPPEVAALKKKLTPM
jgi:hypothetical protein